MRLTTLSGLAVVALACSANIGCGRPPRAAMVPAPPASKEAPAASFDEVKTVQIAQLFDRGAEGRDFDKTVDADGDTLGVRAHADVKDAKVSGTVTYGRKGDELTILEADLVTEGRYEADFRIDVEAKAKAAGDALHGKRIELARNVMPTTFPVAGPLALRGHFDLDAACEVGGGAVHATTGGAIAGEVRLAFKYKKAGLGGESADAKFAFEPTTPSFEVTGKPFLKVDAKHGKSEDAQRSVRTRCSVQPTAVLVFEPAIGARLTVEPWLTTTAQRTSAKTPWSVDSRVHVSISATTDEGAKTGAQEVSLFDGALTRTALPVSATPATAGKVLDAGIRGAVEKPTRAAPKKARANKRR